MVLWYACVINAAKINQEYKEEKPRGVVKFIVKPAPG
jgi:hypothetical protein